MEGYQCQKYWSLTRVHFSYIFVESLSQHLCHLECIPARRNLAPMKQMFTAPVFATQASEFLQVLLQLPNNLLQDRQLAISIHFRNLLLLVLRLIRQPLIPLPNALVLRHQPL
jgi:hypothetical protein